VQARRGRAETRRTKTGRAATEKRRREEDEHRQHNSEKVRREEEERKTGGETEIGRTTKVGGRETRRRAEANWRNPDVRKQNADRTTTKTRGR